jgi:hypothetical protein
MKVVCNEPCSLEERSRSALVGEGLIVCNTFSNCAKGLGHLCLAATLLAEAQRDSDPLDPSFTPFSGRSFPVACASFTWTK